MSKLYGFYEDGSFVKDVPENSQYDFHADGGKTNAYYTEAEFYRDHPEANPRDLSHLGSLSLNDCRRITAERCARVFFATVIVSLIVLVPMSIAGQEDFSIFSLLGSVFFDVIFIAGMVVFFYFPFFNSQMKKYYRPEMHSM